MTPNGTEYRPLTEEENRRHPFYGRPHYRPGLLFRCANPGCKKEFYAFHSKAQEIIGSNRYALCGNKECKRIISEIRRNERIDRALEGTDPWTDGLIVQHVWRRDKGTCQVCGRSDHDVNYETGHKVDEFLGGLFIPDNLTIMCYPCNRLKPPHETLKEYEMWAAHKQTLYPRLVNIGLNDHQVNAAIELFREMLSPRFIIRINKQ